jgi:hypothetical protein
VDGKTTVDFGYIVADLSVKGINDAGNSAVAIGDLIYYVDADTPKLSKKTAGYLFGVAMEAVTSGATDTILVLKMPALGASAISLVDGAVTAAKLSTTLKTGYIPLPLEDFRLIATNDIPAVGTPDGGQLALDTAPKLKRVNGATDKKLRIEWAAASVVEIQSDFAYPPDLDDTAAVVVHLLMNMAGATDTPTVAVAFFEGVGDTNAGGATTALSATVADKTRSIAAGDVGAYPNAASVTLIPGTHATDAMFLYGAWIEYTRK